MSMTPQQIEQKYQWLYSCVGHVIKLVVKDPAIPAGERYAYIRVLANAMLTLAGRESTSRLHKMSLPEIEMAVGAYRAEAAAWYENGEPRRGDQGMIDDARVEIDSRLLRQHIPEDCDIIYDLGTGWGNRLFDLWVSGGPRNAVYLGGELTDNGRRCFDYVVQSCLPGLRAKAFEFNFHEPHFPAPSGVVAKKVAVVSIHGIDQIRTLGPTLFDRLVHAYPKADLFGVHIEPTTHQLPDQQSVDPARFERDRVYAQTRGRNLDLYEQISSRHDFEIHAVQAGIIDEGGGNSSSMIAWRRRGG